MTQIYLTRRQVAELYPISEHTLAKLAYAGRGPTFYKPTDKILYRPEDIDAWIAASVVLPTDASVPRPASKKRLAGRGTYARTASFDAPQPPGGGRKSLPPSPKSVLRKKD
ncbi:helix-turn-helix transcriptional regulator [Devosia limi]|uniref:Helix-turn-helix domain-containing protein n=1 Tax=Devosia limi DSM 17137 TaxID=1121477 RepID=A0A1M5AQI1_9HYPH|nr:helix-turn-helix domain-containing protein [Devosia limi]SHF32416.1 Helix-turn-helix domain-containing protein [Devosia limi DSM 17137]